MEGLERRCRSRGIRFRCSVPTAASSLLRSPEPSDLVHEFDVAGGVWVFSAMQYIPSGGTGTTYFILLNSYGDGSTIRDWSIQTQYNLTVGRSQPGRGRGLHYGRFRPVGAT